MALFAYLKSTLRKLDDTISVASGNQVVRNIVKMFADVGRCAQRLRKLHKVTTMCPRDLSSWQSSSEISVSPLSVVR